jgi:membrane associated rhomboid family serine protease
MDSQLPSAPPAADAAEPLVVELRRAATGQQGEEWALVLASSGIPHRLVYAPPGSALFVESVDFARATALLSTYDEESRPVPQTELTPHGSTWLGWAVVLALVGFFVVCGPAEAGSPFIRAGSAKAERILGAEPWRIVTALTLHGDWMHLLSNSVGALIVVRAAGWWAGPGLALAALVVAGGLGNLATALVHRSHHDSVGASTLVFAAVGLLAVLAAGARRRGERLGPAHPSGPRRGAWLFGAAALGLLAMLGAGPQVDLLAHVFGLLSGALLGAPLALRRRPASTPAQLLGLVVGVAVVLGAWALALDV